MRLKSIKQNKLENRKRSKAFILLVAVILLIAAGSTLYEVQANGHYLFPELNNENLPANKRAELIKAEQQMQEARLHAKPKPDWRTYRPIAPTWAQGVTITPEETPPVGIFSATDTFHASEFIVHNMWERPIGNTWKFAYAGAASTDPASGGTAPFIGAIWTYTGAIGENLEKFPAPAGTGPLTIKSVDGAVLTLQADSGKVIKFNLQTNQYQ